jgi:cytochrome oxidase Cu insertion factor (SCO1/SenC/PrrC family)
MKHFQIPSMIVLAIALLTAPAFALELEDDFPGLQVGEQAPAFTLKDQKNQDISLEDLIKEQPIAIVFHRSASW